MRLLDRRPLAAASSVTLHVAVLALALPALAAAAPQGAGQRPRQDEVVGHAYTLRHQAATDAMALVLPLLSPRGRVEISPGGNTLVLHDSMAALARILPVLYAFDHPAREVAIEVWLIRATLPPKVSPPMPPEAVGVAPDLLRSLREHLPYQSYELVASSRARAFEGERLTFELDAEYAVRFRLGTVLADRRLRLNDFELLQHPGSDPQSLLRSHLNVFLGRTMVLALSAGEGSPGALLVVVRCQLAEPPRAAVPSKP